ncbi:cobalamin B12-binding domain-containing protein [Desulfatibacillum aliphaticivorans]|uniref:cobalamin B12-binding domain-containing protein n=1 Tax=Desulfatibacillum aliphaticivorans TaxID=218208 RepID=UPI00041D5F78|nr:cobalamin-dependent protein [Desulfatibacillum aliphaticivorans]
MSDSQPKKEIPPAEKALLIELISSLQEKDSLRQLKKLHQEGYDTEELLTYCMEGVRRVGVGFEKGEYYISALIMAGEIMRQSAEYLNSFLPTVRSAKELGHILLGTIKGDIHDLGKNILKDMLICNGFKVTDLGVDVPPQTFVEKALELEPDFVAISCLLTNCLGNLAEAVEMVRKAKPEAKDLIIVGGNCLDELINDHVKADRWFTDAALAVQFCKDALESKKG